MTPHSDDVARVLDANLNRAREALRTVEDYARFALADSAAATAAKDLRHRLRPIAAGLDGLLAARAIETDPGRETKTPAERQRTDAADVAAAAFSRAGEALRCIEEYAKLVRPSAAAAAERLRYALYGLEPHVLLRGPRRAALRAAGLYVILTEALCRRPWRETATAVLDAGCTCVQLREKSLSDRELLARACWLREQAAARGALLIVNDRADIARLCGADGVHVGQDDVAVTAARRLAGGHALVGKSTHDLEQLEAALAEAPDYVAVGPMFATTTKPQAAVAGPALLRAARARTALTLVCIGGIDATRAAPLRADGADAICVCSAVISAADPGRAAAELLEAIRAAPASSASSASAAGPGSLTRTGEP